MAKQIRMNIDETLELDYLVEKVSDDAINISSRPSNDATSVDYVSVQKGIFNPQNTGIYQLDINSQTVEIEVTDIPDSGVSRWKFEQDVTDSWGSNNWTDNTSNGFTTDAKVGDYAKLFNGTDDYLENGDIITETGSWTLTAWVYLTDSDYSEIYSTDEDNNNPRGFQFKPKSDNTFQLFDGNGVSTTSATITRNTWQFVALATKNDGDVTIDVNGTREDLSANFNNTNHSLYAGMRSVSRPNDAFTGRIDDGRYYNKKLSDSELDNLRTTGRI
jgi:hypothetical protein